MNNTNNQNPDLRAQYQALTLEELEGLRSNAVLDRNAEQILLDVILEKQMGDGKPDSLIQQQRDESKKERIEYAIKNKDYSLLEPSEINYLANKIILTTESYLADTPIAERLEIVTAECVYGMNAFRDFFAGMRDIFGGRSKASQNILRDARKVCLAELKREALNVGADAVIGVDLDYSEMSGGGKSMLFIVASGTAVKLKKA